jgi:plasmid stability protein
MSKVRTTLTIDEELWKAVRVRAARTGKRDSDVIEAALRRDLGFDLLERLWDRSDLTEDEAMDLALEAQASMRRTDET